MMMLFRPTVLLHVAKRTAASNVAVRNRGKRAAVVSTPFSAATTARGIQIHENRNTPINSENRNTTTIATTTTAAVKAAAAAAAAVKTGKTVSAGQRKLQRSSSSNINSNNSTQQKVNMKQNHTNTSNSNSSNNSSSSSNNNKNIVPTKTTTPSSTVTVVSNTSSFIPDYREKVLQIFQRLAEINNALQERYKAQSYQIAVDNLKRDDYIFLHIPPNIIAPGVDDVRRNKLIEAVHNTPKVGEKLKTKMIEILTTGDLAELHSLQAKPIIRAIQELTQVHGFGPRTAVGLYKKYGVKSVAELQQRVKDQEESGNNNNSNSNNNNNNKSSKKSSSKNGNENDSILHLTEAQRLGLKYHRDISQRIPHEEVRLHEAFLKLRLRKYLGKGYDLSICGSYRRRLPTSGDIDVLITRKTSIHIDAVNRKKNLKGNNSNNSRGEQVLAPQEVLAAFVEALKQERYIEATLAQGSTKFMGVSRLKSYNYNAGATQPKLYPARRLDIRFVEPECFPAALLYFTGSKNFNVVMRAEAIKRRYILNEYGLFRTDAVNTSTGNHDDNDNEDDEDNNNNSNKKNGGSSISKKSTGRARWNAETFQKVLRAQYYSAKTPGFGNDDHNHNDNEDHNEDNDDSVGEKHSKKKPNKQQQQNELAALWREVEARRVKVKHERDVFAALGMTYVQPENREV